MALPPNQALATADPTGDAALAQALAALAGPGSYFTGAERLAIAAQARVARGDAATAPALAPTLEQTAHRIAADAISTRPHHIAEWTAAGYDELAYVELVAVVAMISTIDSYHHGIGRELPPLPLPVAGDPVPVIGEGAKKMNAWLPTVGIALAPTALSALPNEKANKDALNKPLYLADDVIHKYDVEPGRELTRPQMELVAARTSWLNECFF